ncbi:MAG: adenine deaminase [Chitinophagaceae bacterium]|nr:adenine deaminase [Chitinophagaceae bacterium]MCF8288616.1 adenine deaminase [Chitinophagaceae bacterium]MCF8421611.1 adenine deaminase [Chitinophagaceae bacterium]
MQTTNIHGQYVDILNKRIYAAEICIQEGMIVSITECATAPNQFILPGFIDSHVHIESSMLVPSSFARLAVVHGTIGTISDPHEIANVCGLEGVQYMIDNGKKVPFHFFFGAPSCVPATAFETAGANIDSVATAKLLASPDIYYLSEMMNFPGVLHQDTEVMQKIKAAHAIGKPVDGHAPGLMGEQAKQYIEAGISTDHECFTMEEAVDKLSFGMHILIREGSAAKNFEALYELIDDHPKKIMLCSDDKHPDSLLEGHINQLCARAVAKGINVFNVLRAACINPVLHYQLPTGFARVHDPANLILVEDLTNFKVLETYIDGQLVAKSGHSLIEPVQATNINQFNVHPIEIHELQLPVTAYPSKDGLVPVIHAIDGQLITNLVWTQPSIIDNKIVADTEKDILKVVVYNRYHAATPKIGLIQSFGFKTGAIASTVAHDSHNIIAVGVDDESILKAINLVVQDKGGISCVQNDASKVIGLPVAGLMSTADPYQVANDYIEIDKMAKSLGTPLGSPYMTLSFMALLVIPHLKMSDLGLFDGDQFKLY